MVKTKWTRRKSFGESAGDATGEDATDRETRQTPLEKGNLEQRTNTVELPTTKPAEDAEYTSKERTPRRRRTRSSTLMDLSNAAREMARAITTGDVEEDIIDITDGWETPIPQRKPKREREPAPPMVEFGREIKGRSRLRSSDAKSAYTTNRQLGRQDAEKVGDKRERKPVPTQNEDEEIREKNRENL